MEASDLISSTSHQPLPPDPNGGRVGTGMGDDGDNEGK